MVLNKEDVVIIVEIYHNISELSQILNRVSKNGTNKYLDCDKYIRKRLTKIIDSEAKMSIEMFESLSNDIQEILKKNNQITDNEQSLDIEKKISKILNSINLIVANNS